MKNIFALLCLLFYSFVFGQTYQLTGKIVDQNNQALSNQLVLLAVKDSLANQQTLTNDLGEFIFEVEKNSYDISLEQQGQEIFLQRILLDKNMALGSLKVENTFNLEGVTITKKKKLIEQQIDRMVFNVENSIAAQGMDGLDALRSTPLVRLENDAISIIGKNNVSVMINDRPLQLSGSDLQNYLRSLRSEDIARIEVITTPPAKYEAQGNSGIINIILKKNTNLGWNGSISTTYQRNSYNGYRIHPTVNYQSEKISSSLKIRYYNMGYKMDSWRNLVSTEKSVYTNSNRKDSPRGSGFNYSLDYKMNEQSNIGLIYDFSQSNYNVNAENTATYFTRTIQDSILTTNENQHWKTPTHTVNLYYDLKLDSIGKKMSITTNYLGTTPDKRNQLNTISDTDYLSFVRNFSKMNYSIFSGQIDFTLPFSTFKMDTGAKYTLLSNKSDVKFYELKNDDYLLNPMNSNVFDYSEKNYATYVSIQKDFNEHWSAKAGLRYELTDYEGKSETKSVAKNNYGKFFPTAYVSYKTNQNTFTLNYSKRINRPGFQEINPFRWYSNPYLYYAGNSSVQPSFNDNIEFSFNYKSKLNTQLYYQFTKNDLTNVSRLEDGIYSNVIENSFNQNRFGLNLNYFDTYFKRWEMVAVANTSYTKTLPLIKEVESLSIYSFYFSINNTFTLNKDKTYFLLLNYWQDLPWTYANTKMSGRNDLSLGLRASFFNKNLQTSLVVNDIFNQVRNYGNAHMSGYNSSFYQFMDYRKLTLSLTYSFGNKEIKGNTKKINFEDKSRAN